MVKRIYLLLVALTLVLVIVGGQVQAQLTPPVPAPTPTSPVTIRVEKIEVTGSTIFGEADFNPIIKPVEGRTVTLEELRGLADAISQLYLDRGYITSRAVLVEPISSGVVRIIVIEGTLGEIQVEGTRQVDPDDICNRVRRGAGIPLNTDELEDQIRLLRADPLFENVEASLRAGTELGQSILVVRVTEGDHIRTRVQLSGNSPLSIAPASLFERFQSTEVRVIARPVESRLTSEFDQYLQLIPTINNIEDIFPSIDQVKQQTGIKAAFIWATFVPSLAIEGHTIQTKQDNDLLELVLMTAPGEIIRKRILNAKRELVMETANQFRREITNPIKRRTTSYLAPSQQLYQWLIAPLQAELEAEGIQNLVFIMDAGLGSLPIAALHDGQGFLVEKYSIGLMPSFGLTDTRYVDIKDAPVLAMGISEANDLAQSFNLSPLPTIPLELQTIVRIRGGQVFLNEKFTLENLKSQRAPIIHLATHGEFKPGPLENSYILLWDTPLRLNQLRELGWKQSPSVELLVLSASRTAAGDEQAELGFAGFAIQAGVKSALASLWYVSNEGTLRLMTEFYRQLQTAPIRAEALRQAQLEMIRGDVRIVEGQLQNSRENIALPPILEGLEDQPLSHPYYWAAFTMIGSPW